MRKFNKKFTMGIVKYDLQVKNPPRETMIVVSLQEDDGIVNPWIHVNQNPIFEYGISEKGEVYSVYPDEEKSYGHYTGHKTYDYPDELSIEEARQVAEEFRFKEIKHILEGGWESFFDTCYVKHVRHDDAPPKREDDSFYWGKIRRRVEDALRKTNDRAVLLSAAKNLGVKIA